MTIMNMQVIRRDDFIYYGRICVLIVVVFLCSSLFAKVYYISPNGKGIQFTYSSPGSLWAVRDAIRKDKTDEQITVIFKDGWYRPDSIFRLKKEDLHVKSIVFRAEHPGKAIISGGREFSGWKAKGKLWEMNLPSGLNFRQIYVNGSRVIRSRQPNEGKRYQLKKWDESGKTIVIDTQTTGPWQYLNEVEMVVHKHWNEDHLRIQAFENHGNETTVLFMQPERDLEFISPHPRRRSGQSFYFENASEFVDAPGEWYYNKRTGKLLYYPLLTDKLSTCVTIPLVETLFSLENVNNVTIRDLEFCYTNWSQCSETGFNGSQGGYFRSNIHGVVDNFVPKTGAVEIKDCRYVLLIGNVIRYTGAIGINLISGTNGTRIIGNVFYRTGGNGLMIMSDLHGTPCRNDTVTNNYFVRCADVYPGSVPLIMTYAHGTVIMHNEVAYAPYSGISAGWGWTDKTTSLYGTKINYNYIHNFCYLIEDGGAIYTLSKQPESEIKYNFCEKSRPSTFTEHISPNAGLYLDQATQGFDIEDNVLRDIITNMPLKNMTYISADRVEGKNTIKGTVTENRNIESSAGLESGWRYIKKKIRLPEPPSPGVLEGTPYPISPSH